MIVADLLKRELFPDFSLLGGSTGLNRSLLSVSVIDSPDVDRWMRGGELLVGSGYIFKENPL
ncbi:MAG: PucR family transcriptional regulator ligand-binding domain-containing protein, partial [Synergistaceae bacterium]|nr:PucR family transcriptional regulator ligand-binding domain-containing protein [Synergistaceae bacterium]